MAIMLAKNDIFYHVLFEYLKNIVKKIQFYINIISASWLHNYISLRDTSMKFSGYVDNIYSFKKFPGLKL